MKQLISFLTVVAVVLSMAVMVSAAGSVTYDGDADKFIFAPGTEESPTSLFENFRDVMPGDKLTEKVVVKNDPSNGVKIKLYIRSLGAVEGSEALLEQMKLTVTQDGDSILFDAPADQTAQLTDWVYLGTVYSGGEIVLDVTLEVPITMGDEFQNQVGMLDWQFKIEELPVEPSDPDLPETGDDFSLYFYLGILVLCVLAFILLFFAAKGKRREEQAE